MNRILLSLLLLLLTVSLRAQHITGTVVDSQSGETLPAATVKLLKTDSTMVKGVLTDADGLFRLEAPAAGKYIVQVTNVGYETYAKSVTVSGKDVSMGTLSMKADAIALEEAVVTAQAAKVTLRKDTFVYNASAFRTPEGSTIEELVKKLPGAEVSDDGTITINGKQVKKIKIDGKEFMTGDTQTALKNLPTSIVNQIKSYDEKSDLARVSGIDDGNEETVLDFTVKPGMNKGMFANADLALATHKRYAERLMGARFDSKLKVMFFANANNTNDQGFPGGGGGFRGGGMTRNGLVANKMVGLNINYEPNRTFKWDGSVRWNHSNSDATSRTATQNFYTSRGSFQNSLTQNDTRANRWNMQMRLEWQPDTMTNIMFRPRASFNTNDGVNTSSTAVFSVNPYRYTDDPLLAVNINAMLAANDTSVINSNTNASISYNRQNSLNGTLQLNRKLSNNGRNVTLVLGGGYGDTKGQQIQSNVVHLYQILDQLGNDSTYQTNRYSVTPNKNWNYSLRATYSEPLLRRTYLQFSYEYQYLYQKSDRSTYDFSQGYDFSGVEPFYRGWDDYLSQLRQPLDSYLDVPLSRYSEYKNYIHTGEVMLRVVRDAYNLNVGLQFIPQKSHFVQRYQGLETDTTRTVFNFTPTADFRWKISDVSQLRITYRGQTSQPSMSDLLDITDNSNPLNITRGNPGLKPSFTNNFRLFYNNYIPRHMRAIMAHVTLSTTRNSIANMVTYDPTTGGRTSQPQNINGNWNTNGFFMFNTAIDSTGYYNVNTSTNLSYARRVGFVNLDRSATATKSNTHTFTIGERIAASYRNGWIEFEPNGSLSYTHSTNSVQTSANLDTWNFSYGFNTNITLPWGTRIATDLNMNSRRGFSDDAMNTNELIWNAQVSHSFLKGGALTVSLQFFDLLNQQSNITRSINEMMRNDTEYNAINQYAMLHVIYRLNIFGGRPGGPRDGGGFGGPGGRGGRGGGFGGGRPGGGFGGGRHF